MKDNLQIGSPFFMVIGLSSSITVNAKLDVLVQFDKLNQPPTAIRLLL